MVVGHALQGMNHELLPLCSWGHHTPGFSQHIIPKSVQYVALENKLLISEFLVCYQSYRLNLLPRPFKLPPPIYLEPLSLSSLIVPAQGAIWRYGAPAFTVLFNKWLQVLVSSSSGHSRGSSNSRQCWWRIWGLLAAHFQQPLQSGWSPRSGTRPHLRPWGDSWRPRLERESWDGGNAPQNPPSFRCFASSTGPGHPCHRGIVSNRVLHREAAEEE